MSNDSAKQNGNTAKPWLWTKGKSGNPKGRPPKERSVTNCIREILEQTEFQGQTINGGRKVAWAIAEALVKGALQGDIQFIKEIIDRIEGKPIQVLASSEDEMNSIQERMMEYESLIRNGDGNGTGE